MLHLITMIILLVCMYAYIISYIVYIHNTYTLCNIHISTHSTYLHIPCITIYTDTYMIIIPIIPMHTCVYVHFTYELQECVYFRQDAHTAAEQTPTPTYHTTTSHTISFKSRVSDLYRHIIMVLILLYELYQLTTIFVTDRKGNKKQNHS